MQISQNAPVQRPFQMDLLANFDPRNVFWSSVFTKIQIYGDHNNGKYMHYTCNMYTRMANLYILSLIHI